jgi:hypothetical protein
MKPNPGSLALVAALFLSTPSYADATPTAEQKLASVQYLVGTWKCAHTVGAFSGTYTTTYANVLGNLWLKQTYDFPATQTEPARQAETLMGYDQGRQYWVRFFAMSNGQYFIIRMADADGGGWSWKYASISKNRKPETPGIDATFTRKSDAEYAVDGPSYPENGTTVTEHHICKKL